MLKLKLKIIYLFWLPITANLLFLNKSYSQSITFSSDTVIVQKCDNQFSVAGIIKVYNTTNNQITLNWVMTQSAFPVTGWNALIIDPVQFPPSYSGGTYSVDANDSTDILFHIVPDSMTPGDTAIFQIMVYNALDSMNTATYLTALAYCPITSATGENTFDQSIILFPNPVNSSFSLRFSRSNNKKYSFLLYSDKGLLVKKIDDIIENTINIKNENLNSGLWYYRLWNDEHVIGSGKLIIVN